MVTLASSVSVPRSMGTASAFIARAITIGRGALAAAFHDRQHLADLGSGGRGVELGAAERVGDGLLARLIEQRLGFADFEIQTRRLIGASGDEPVEDVAELVEIAHQHLHLVGDAVAVDLRGLPLDGPRVARLDAEDAVWISLASMPASLSAAMTFCIAAVLAVSASRAIAPSAVTPEVMRA